MASSYLDYQGRSLRLTDGILIIVFKFLIKEGRTAYAWRPDILDAFSEWDRGIEVAGPGLLDLNLNGMWETQEGRHVLLSLLSSIEISLSAFGTTVPAHFLDELVGFDQFRHCDVEVNYLLKTIEQIKDLLMGK